MPSINMWVSWRWNVTHAWSKDMQEKKEIHRSEKSAMCQEGNDLCCELEGRNSEIFFSQDQRAYREGIVRVYYRLHNHLEDKHIFQSQSRESKCSGIFQNEGIQIPRYLHKDVFC